MNITDLVQGQLNSYKATKVNESNLQEKTSALKNLKILSLSLPSLPPSTKPPVQIEYILAREILELEMELSCILKNERAFELSYLQIKPFYFDYIKPQFFSKGLPKSEKFLYYVGLYLLFLLSNNRTTDFSTELELLNVEDRNSHYIKVSLDIEQCIMEGNYSQLARLKNSNDKFYNYYLNKFDDTTRYQIARSMEKSYQSLNVNEAMKLLMFSNQQDLGNFIRQQNEGDQGGEKEINWKLTGDKIEFIPLNENKAHIPAYRIFADALLLGIETEKII